MSPPTPVEKAGAEVELKMLHQAPVADSGPAKAAPAPRPRLGGGK